MNYKDIYQYPDPEHLAPIIAEKVMNLVRKSIIEGKDFSIALSGGRTPKILFDHIAGQYPDPGIWERVKFFWVDERCVPPDHPDSNYLMAYESLLRYLDHPNYLVYRIRGEDDPHEEAKRYSKTILEQVPQKAELPAFDLILLGMGADGHTASIFPGQMELLWTDKLCGVGVHPESGQMRITLSGKLINNADNIWFLITGKDKARPLAGILCGEAEDLPAYHIKPAHGNISWFLDDEAARLVNKMKNPG